jgi:hypothetical protein
MRWHTLLVCPHLTLGQVQNWRFVEHRLHATIAHELVLPQSWQTHPESGIAGVLLVLVSFGVPP